MRPPQRTIPPTLVPALALTACSPGSDGGTAAGPAPEEAPASAGAAGPAEPADPYAVTAPEPGERLHLPLYDHVLDEHEQWTVSRPGTPWRWSAPPAWATTSRSAPTRPRARRCRPSSGPTTSAAGTGRPGWTWPASTGSRCPRRTSGAPASAATRTPCTRCWAATRPPVPPLRRTVPGGGRLHQADLRLNPDSPPPNGEGLWEEQENGLVPDTPGTRHLAEDLSGTAYAAARQDPAVAAADEEGVHGPERLLRRSRGRLRGDRRRRAVRGVPVLPRVPRRLRRRRGPGPGAPGRGVARGAGGAARPVCGGTGAAREVLGR
ncbi:hypothetical protein SUDANB121_04826 [Nocardiopsis dassonvillei]